MIRLFWVPIVLIISGPLLSSCDSGSSPSSPVQTTGGTGPGTGTVGKPIVLPSQLEAKALQFFNNKVLPLVKDAPCTDCHADPREVVIEKGGLAPQSFSKMYALLKDGPGANDNKLFNMMRGLVAHPGGAQCTTEGSPFCAVLQEWYRAVFGDGTLALGRVTDISPSSGRVSGWAGTSAAATSSSKIRFYLDGEAGRGTMIGEVTANLDAFDNNLEGNHGFAFSIPVANIDNKSHKIYAYALDGQGKEVALSGSPYSYTAFKPKNTAAAQQQYNTIFAGCNGNCHAFTYASKWSSLVGGFGSAGWGKTNNALYNKLNSGAHGGPSLAGKAPQAETWWVQEFPELSQ